MLRFLFGWLHSTPTWSGGVKLTQLGEFSSRLEALTQVNDPARSLAIGPVSEAVRDGEVLYASGEKVGSEYEAMDSQLTANLVDAKLVHVEENLRERDEKPSRPP